MGVGVYTNFLSSVVICPTILCDPHEALLIMMFRTSVLAVLSAVASATIVPNDIPATSKLGSRLLSKATVVEDARHLEQERDVTFVASYSLKYLGCSSLVQVREEGGGDEGILYTQNLVRFALCPTSATCSSCSNGGEYVVSMMEFVDLYTEHKLNDKEWACEMIRENCYCDNANDDEVCENQCYNQQGMPECIEYEGEEEFEIQRYLECQGALNKLSRMSRRLTVYLLLCRNGRR